LRRSSPPSSRSCCCRLRLWRSICSPSPPISTCRNSASASTAIDPPRLDPLSLLAGNVSHSPAGSESQIVVQYMTSRAVIDQLDAALDLHRMFSPPEADWWSRLPRPTSIEGLVQYWRGQVDPFYDPANGTVVVRVRAFTPSEALQLAQAIVAASEQPVNDRSTRARHDALRNGDREVIHAESRLEAAFGEIR